MNALSERIAAMADREGPVDIARYMALCLYDPAHGAYAARNPVGEAGDFVTAPEISQTFGEMCGLWVVQSWHNLGRPARPRLVELGPGRGTLMRDGLRAIGAAAKKFFVDAEVVLVERSPALAALQREALKDAPVSVRWVESFDKIAPDRPLFLVANEFFDCLPIRQYVKAAQGWAEKMVTAKDGALSFALAAAPGLAAVLPPAYAEAPEGAVYESSPAAAAIIEDVARMLAAKGGAALVFDYGYDRPSFAGTLQAVRRHEKVDVLAAPGDSDLSAHVDFAALKAAAKRAGAAAFGPKEQGDLLISLGIEVRAQRLMLANPKAAPAIAAAVKRLVADDQMGILFKALALTAPGAPVPPGFEPC